MKEMAPRTNRKKRKRKKVTRMIFENANDDDYCVQELENHMMQKGWNVLSRSFRTGYTAEEVSKRLGNVRCHKIWAFLYTKSAPRRIYN